MECHIDIHSLVNESDVNTEIRNGIDVIQKRDQERWVPDSMKQRASSFLDQVREGWLDYLIYFTHGMFIAAVLLECEARRVGVTTPFDNKRDYYAPPLLPSRK